MTANVIVRVEQVLVARRDAAVETKAVGEEVGQRDQPRVQRDLRQGVTVDGKGRGADPAAHRAVYSAPGGEPRLAIGAQQSR